MANSPINTTRKQRALPPRKEPYWHTFRKGAAVGLYVGTTRKEWWARALGPDRTYRYTTLGAGDSLTFEEAEQTAREFADSVSRTDRPDYTVRDAIADYVEHLRKAKGVKAAADAEGRLNKHVVPTFGSQKLVHLRARELNRWLRGMVPDGVSDRDQQRAKSTANRTLNSFKAALNLAFIEGAAPTDAEWRRVKAFPSADAARELFLTPLQVEGLLKAADGAFQSLLRAAVLTGARYGELGSAKVRDLDSRRGTLRLNGKTGTRDCYLSGEALGFFRGLACDKLPDAPLLMREDGTPWGKDNQRKPFIRAARAAGLPTDAVFYSIRHYYISRALLAGIPAQAVAENCGTSIRMLELHYGKFLDADRRRMMDRVAL